MLIGSLDMVKNRLWDIAFRFYHSYDFRKTKSGLTEAESAALHELSSNLSEKCPQGTKKANMFLMKHIKEGNNRDSQNKKKKKNFLVIGRFKFQHIQLLRQSPLLAEIFCKVKISISEAEYAEI